MDRMLRQLGIYYQHLPGNLSYNKFACGVVLHIIHKNENVECWNNDKRLFFWCLCDTVVFSNVLQQINKKNVRDRPEGG